MIRIVLYQNTNQKIAEAYGKWLPRVVSDETIGLEELAAHMASHTPLQQGRHSRHAYRCSSLHQGELQRGEVHREVEVESQSYWRAQDRKS